MFEYSFTVNCIDIYGDSICVYDGIEADTEFDAKVVSREFCLDDYPDCKFYEAQILEAERIG